MSNLRPIVRARIEALAEYVEHNGAGALRGTNELTPFNLSQAETYLRFYQGYMREVQVQSIESSLIDPDDPLYGWGWIAQHEPSIKVLGAAQQWEIHKVGSPFKEADLHQKRLQTAELHIVKQRVICPTLPMCIIAATVTPVFVPDVRLETVQSRISRVRKQVTQPGLAEKLYRVRCRTMKGGVEIRIPIGQFDIEIGPIKHSDRKG